MPHQLEPAQNASNPADGLSPFLRVRPRLFGMAFRMLRNAVEAEDLDRKSVV